tara:strand:- start:341 stop:775 length:435 start_codon:yes stop_codon:yes gene_type:complete
MDTKIGSSVNFLDEYKQTDNCYIPKISSRITEDEQKLCIKDILSKGGFFSDNGLWIYNNDRKAVMIPLDIRSEYFKELEKNGQIRFYKIMTEARNINRNSDALYPGKTTTEDGFYAAVGLFCFPEFKNTLSMTFGFPFEESLKQ